MAHNSAEKMVSDGNLCLIEPSMLGEKIAVPIAFLVLRSVGVKGNGILSILKGLMIEICYY